MSATGSRATNEKPTALCKAPCRIGQGARRELIVRATGCMTHDSASHNLVHSPPRVSNPVEIMPGLGPTWSIRPSPASGSSRSALHRTFPIVIGKTKGCFGMPTQIMLNNSAGHFWQLQMHVCISKVSRAKQHYDIAEVEVAANADFLPLPVEPGPPPSHTYVGRPLSCDCDSGSIPDPIAKFSGHL
jgi:hypothetical protein